MAAEGGDVEAQCRLGYFYEEGEEVRRNDEPNGESSLKWYLKAAEGNNADAQGRLGLIFNGNTLLDVPIDKEKSFGGGARQRWADKLICSGVLE